MSDFQTAPFHSSRSRSALAELRPASPGQLALVGLAVWIVGVFFHVLAVLLPIGIGLLLLAGLGQLIRPRARTMYWRGRELDLGEKPTPSACLYRAIFKR